MFLVFKWSPQIYANLNEFLLQDAKQYAKGLLAVTCAMIMGPVLVNRR